MRLVHLDQNYVKQHALEAKANLDREIKVYPASSRLSLSYGLVKLLQLNETSRVCLSYDFDNPTEWYIYVHDLGLPIKPSKKGLSYWLSSKAIVDVFQEYFAGDLTFPVAKQASTIQGITCYAIFTTKQAEAKRIQKLTTPKADTT